MEKESIRVEVNLAELRKKIAPVAKEFGVETIYLFGSFARNEANVNSDYDLFIRKGQLKGLLQLIRFESFLEKVLGRKVDVVTSGVHNESLLNSIRRDGVLLYES